MASYLNCDGRTRRDVLKVGVLGAAGLSLGGYLRRTAQGEVRQAPAKAAIFVNLGGGPSHMDTFDLKPAAPSEQRGEFNPIATNVPGVELCEHLPKLAACADKFAILRGVSHTLAAHDLGTKYMITGNRPLPSLEFPGYGSVVAKELPSPPDLPAFVAIPTTAQRSGYLGVRYAAMQTNATPQPNVPFTVRGISIGRGVTVTEMERRQHLLTDLDTAFRGYESSNDLVDGLDEFSQQAQAIISSPRAREAFDTSRESPAIAEPFGGSPFGQSCLLACRLIESGVRFATVTFGGWDMHRKIFETLKNDRLAQLDAGLASLFNTLALKGLLDSTAVFVTGEFGRTPKINENAGRDHWPRAMFCLIAGGGFKGGQVIGASDERGMGPAGDPIAPDAIAASFYHALGIDYHKEYHTSTGRPVMIVRQGEIVPQLFA